MQCLLLEGQPLARLKANAMVESATNSVMEIAAAANSNVRAG
jgi:hypothetical protein